MRRMTKKEWNARGASLYGTDPKKWVFRCPACGHRQSGIGVYELNPGVKAVQNWIYSSCEGRYNPKVGCDWTLGGLLKIHRIEVTDDEGGNNPVFEFADDPPSQRPYKQPREWMPDERKEA